MIYSEILDEKDRVQAKLSEESASIHEYMRRSRCAAKEIAESYGVELKYVTLPNKTLQRTRQRREPLSLDVGLMNLPRTMEEI